MKKIYTLMAVAAMSSLAMAQSGSYITEDTDLEATWDLSDFYSTTGLTIENSTATVKFFCLNASALPPAFVYTGEWQPVTLKNGGVVKFFDEPKYDYPTPENFEEIDMPAGFDGSWDDVAPYVNTKRALENDWVIKGTGNAIYLDSRCRMGGTISGVGELTIYVSNNDTLDFLCGNLNNPDSIKTFMGTIYIKSLDGYACDTINFGSTFRPGYNESTGASCYMSRQTYAGSCTLFDITSFGGNVVWNQSAGNSLVYPAITGKGKILTGTFPYFNGGVNINNEAITATYDADVILTNSETHDFEVYGNSLVFNGTITGQHRYMYVRSASQVYFNNPAPSLSDFVQSFSQRGAGITGGNGFADIAYYPNTSRGNILSPGCPYTEVGQMTWRDIHMEAGDYVRFDFDNAGHVDVLNVTGTYTMFAGQNEVQIGLPDNFVPKAGKYKVINGNIDAGMSTYVDTIGYEVWDNNGPAYVIRSINGGEIVKLADGSDDNYVAQPGDSIGSANFGQLAGTYGATIMDGNRPHYVIAEWGPGSFSNGELTDGSYKNTEDPKLYTPNEAQMGTAFSDPDSTRWEAEWQEFLATHPVSNAWEPVDISDPSVIPGTVTDSIFLTYSRYRTVNGENGVAGEHDWSWRNGSGSSCKDKGYPYAGAKHFAYYYYSNNNMRLYSVNGGNYINAAGDTLAVASFARESYPIALTQNHDSVMHVNPSIVDDVEVNDTTYTFVTDTVGWRFYTNWSPKIDAGNGDSIQFRFNFKNYISDGIIAIETQLTKATGEVEQNLPAEEDKEEIVNEDDLVGIGTMLKENHAVDSREIFTLTGVKVKNAASGFSIVRTVYTDGKVETRKVIFK